jgi:tRNA pseudouridine55 synthase
VTFPSGFLIIDKPTGVTSFSMVSMVRRLTGVRRVGHAGTLDPLATGVLPVAVGQATRLIEYLDDQSKVYVARVRFGVETDSYDADGAVTASADASALTRTGVEEALGRFVGEIEQAPPAYSAIKLAGKPAYRYAREGESVEIPARKVRIERVSLISFTIGEHAEAEVEVVCSPGTYIRSLAHDLGRELGVGAHLTALRRTSSGGFGVELARSPERLQDVASEGRLEEALLAPDRAVERYRAAIVGERHAADVASGRPFGVDLAPAGRPLGEIELCRAYDVSGRFLGVLEGRQDGRLHPAKVLAAG